MINCGESSAESLKENRDNLFLNNTLVSVIGIHFILVIAQTKKLHESGAEFPKPRR